MFGVLPSSSVLQQLRALVAMNENLKRQEQQFKAHCKVGWLMAGRLPFLEEMGGCQCKGVCAHVCIWMTLLCVCTCVYLDDITVCVHRRRKRGWRKLLLGCKLERERETVRNRWVSRQISIHTTITATSDRHTVDWKIFAVKIIRVLNFRVKNISPPNCSAM